MDAKPPSIAEHFSPEELAAYMATLYLIVGCKQAS